MTTLLYTRTHACHSIYKHQMLARFQPKSTHLQTNWKPESNYHLPCPYLGPFIQRLDIIELIENNSVSLYKWTFWIILKKGKYVSKV